MVKDMVNNPLHGKHIDNTEISYSSSNIYHRTQLKNMAFTKITGYGISETTDLHVGIITATSGLKGIGIFSGGTAIHSGVITSLNFVGSGNTFAVGGANNGVVDISIAGGSGGGALELELIKFFMRMIFQSLKVIQLVLVKNAMSAASITLAGSVVVTIPSGSTWTVV